MRSIIKKEHVRELEPGAARPAAAEPSGRRHAKSVELLDLDGRVHAIQLTCSCGEVSVIDLEYPEDPAPGGAR